MTTITQSRLWRSVLIASAILTGCLSVPAQAETTTEQTSAQPPVTQIAPEPTNAISAPVTSIGHVKPTDWTFQALKSIAERYGCVPDYASKTLQSNRAINRYEFAAILNACMDGMNDLIASTSANSIRKEDLASIRKLQEQFMSELDTLRGRSINLEPRKTATLEKEHFSTISGVPSPTIIRLQTRTTDNVTRSNHGPAKTSQPDCIN